MDAEETETRGKRLEMTRVACAAADQIWATSDNPRTENIESIFGDMKKGFARELRSILWKIEGVQSI